MVMVPAATLNEVTVVPVTIPVPRRILPTASPVNEVTPVITLEPEVLVPDVPYNPQRSFAIGATAPS